jgi:hypothetical protein
MPPWKTGLCLVNPGNAAILLVNSFAALCLDQLIRGASLEPPEHHLNEVRQPQTASRQLEILGPPELFEMVVARNQFDLARSVG